MKFRGQLTDANIDKLQQYYGNAVRANVGDLDAMIKACWAVFEHSSSCDKDLRHDYCPTGPDTWCKYNYAVLKGVEQDYTHKTKPDIPPKLAPYVKYVWASLCDCALLDKCLMGATQNRNESFNSIVWSRCSQTEFCSPPAVQLAIHLAFLTFNRGMSVLLPLIEEVGGSKPGLYCTMTYSRLDCAWLYHAKRHQSEVEKKRRKSKRVARLESEELAIQKEGVTYEAGGF